MRFLSIAMLALACDTGSSTCAGGGDPSAVIGVEDVTGFTPYDDGDVVPVVDSGGAALHFDFEVRGIDAEQDVTVVLRLDPGTGQGTQDYLATAAMRCGGDAVARYGADAPWPGTWPDPADLDGETLGLEAVFTDVHGVSATGSLEFVLDADP